MSNRIDHEFECQRGGNTNGKIMLNLGCGNMTKHTKFIHCDKEKTDGVNVIFDMDVFPYPFKDNCVDVIVASGVIAHLKHPIKFWREIRRIMKKEHSVAHILKCSCKGNSKFNRNTYFEKYSYTLEVNGKEYTGYDEEKSFEGFIGIPEDVIFEFGQEITDVYRLQKNAGDS